MFILFFLSFLKEKREFFAVPIRVVDAIAVAGCVGHGQIQPNSVLVDGCKMRQQEVDYVQCIKMKRKKEC